MTAATQRGHSPRLLRPKEIYQRLGLGHTKVQTDYFFHQGGDPFIPGTRVRRLKLVHLGPRSVAALEDEVDALIEGLRQHRDAGHDDD
jgi:hypothetical protein